MQFCRRRASHELRFHRSASVGPCSGSMGYGVPSALGIKRAFPGRTVVCFSGDDQATSPHDPEVLYYGSQYIHRTRDKGVTWERISPDLTARPECCQGISGEPITRDITGEEFYSTLYAITESPLEKGVIWTGAPRGSRRRPGRWWRCRRR